MLSPIKYLCYPQNTFIFYNSFFKIIFSIISSPLICPYLTLSDLDMPSPNSQIQHPKPPACSHFNICLEYREPPTYTFSMHSSSIENIPQLHEGWTGSRKPVSSDSTYQISVLMMSEFTSTGSKPSFRAQMPLFMLENWLFDNSLGEGNVHDHDQGVYCANLENACLVLVSHSFFSFLVLLLCRF